MLALKRLLRARRGGGWMWGVLGGALVACGGRATPVECDALVRRYAEKLVDRERPALSRGERERLVEAAIAEAKRGPAFARCPAEVSQASARCAEEAFDPDQIERCLIFVP